MRSRRIAAVLITLALAGCADDSPGADSAVAPADDAGMDVVVDAAGGDASDGGAIDPGEDAATDGDVLADGVAPPEGGSALSPQLATKGELLIDDDFETPHELDPALWEVRHGARAVIEGGILTVLPSTEEYREEAIARGDSHIGDSPRLVTHSGAAYIVELYLRTEGGPPELLFGAHNVRVTNDGDELILKKGGETFDSAPSFRLETGTWYHVMLELEGSSVVVQIEDGPTLRASDPSFAESNTDFRIFGAIEGTLFLDDFQLWSAEPRP